jgi:alpha-glucosidase
VDQQEGDRGSILEFTRTCLKLRSAHAALHHGAISVIEAADQKLVFERSHGNERLRCVFNLSDRPVRGGLSGNRLISSGHIDGNELGPYAAVIEKIA